MISNLISKYKTDFYAGIVVFFVALPLCLGIAMASGAPLFSGIIAGIIGGIVIGFANQSSVGVSGPAAGLVVIVLNAIEQLGSWEAFLLAVFLAGILQIIMGYAKLGIIAYYFPSSVIKGMLTGIGLLIIIKQIPYIFGYLAPQSNTADFGRVNEATFSTFFQDGFSNIADMITPGVIIITLVSLGILLLWEIVRSKKHRIFQVLQGPLVVVSAGIFLNYTCIRTDQIFYSFRPTS